ncbi:DMP19 family protein [Diaphorobacter sp. HDW4A]|uniref:DMP19 family protein n=1 Tax=Diaphorobacter sp. HDW4A TaxID=2714924 RepID=UPI001409DCCF|nr:DUF4375 domain-containing protein [Diaphorobacter sp. HDW4A]QIL82133.1 DMP19 family protein [Diaphorobacter sp. HDW4A]
MLLSPTILVSKEALNSEDSYDLVESNIDSVNELLERLVEYEEMSPEALKSYYVDYYLAQVKNGGFAQFIYNIGCDGEIIELVQQGLADMQAVRHAALLDKSLAIIDRLSEEELDRFLDSEYFGENTERDALNECNGEFYDLNEHEDLVDFNSRWLRQHPQLQAVAAAGLEAVFDEISEKIPDLEERAAEALENQPRYVKVIDELCDASGQELERITAGDPTHQHEGKDVLAWHFLTDAGHFYMVDLGDKALMFEADTHKLEAEADVSFLDPEEDD